MIENIINGDLFLIVFSGVVIFVAQRLISDLWITPNIEFEKCLGKIDTLLIKYEFLCGYEFGSNDGANDEDVRFFKKGSVVWNEMIHSVPITTGRGADISDKEEFAIIHHHYDSISQYLERLDRYTNAQSSERVEKGEKFSMAYPTLNSTSFKVSSISFWSSVNFGFSCR